MPQAIPFYCIRFSDATPDPERVADLLSEAELPAGSWHDLETGERIHTLYYTSPEERDETLAENLVLLEQWRREEGAVISEVEVFDLPAEDWSEAWKRFFTIQHLSPALVVKPTWLEYSPTAGQTVIEIDPGMSFGTGRHATTAFCLRQIEQRVADMPKDCGLLDAGTGSGILAIGAALLGFKPIEAFDYDPFCIPCSQENAELNHLPSDAIHFFQADLTLFPTDRSYGIVIANILAPVLMSEVKRLSALTRPGGYLILAGILSTEYLQIKTAFTACGFEEVASETLKEWTGGTFRKQKG